MPIEPKQPTVKGAADWFTGDVYIDPVVRATEPSRVNVSAVRFAPGARTAWHSHTVSQTLDVTDGVGLHQPRDGAVEHIRAGDVVVTPADMWHWHGATADHYMTPCRSPNRRATGDRTLPGASTSATRNTKRAEHLLVSASDRQQSCGITSSSTRCSGKRSTENGDARLWEWMSKPATGATLWLAPT